MVLLAAAQWIGISIGGLAALVVLLTLFLLLSAFRYSVRVDTAGAPDKPRVSATATWLCRLVRFDFRMNGKERRFRLRVLWKTIGKKTGADEDGAADMPAPPEETDKKVSIKEKPEAKATDNNTDSVKEETQKEGFIERIKRQIDLFINFPDKKLIWGYTKKLVLDVLRWLRPRRFALRGAVGFDSPDITGMAMGAFGVVRAATGWDMRVTANFEEEEIALKGLVAGRLRLWTLAWLLLRYVLRKPIWKIVKPKLFKKKAKKRRR